MTYGIESLPLLSLGAGVVCIAVFLLGWDKYVTFLPSGVNIGFTFGVAIIIAANQIPAMFNLSGLASQPSFIANVAQNIKAAATEGDLRACAVCIMFWVPLFTLNLKYNGKPWLLLTVVLGCLLGIVSSAGWLGVAWKASLSTIKDKYGSLTLSLFKYVKSRHFPPVSIVLGRVYVCVRLCMCTCVIHLCFCHLRFCYLCFCHPCTLFMHAHSLI